MLREEYLLEQKEKRMKNLMLDDGGGAECVWVFLAAFRGFKGARCHYERISEMMRGFTELSD